jgi:hypothetical protein
MDNGFNKTINNVNEQKGNSGETLIGKLDLKIGKEISLVKRSVMTSSPIDAGQKIEGKLIKDIHIGSSIYLENSNTGQVKEMQEVQGRYFVKTLTSIYELIIKTKEKENLEKIPELQETIENIELNIHVQPQSLQNVWNSVKDKICKKVKIQNKNFLFTNISFGLSNQVLAFVQDENNKDIWKTRVFRYSGSDHQWKSYPGKRADGSIMKGEENNELHHYVQSAKLHKDIYKTIETLPKASDNGHYSEYIPRQSKEGIGGKYENEFEFKENYETLKNKEWAQFQNFAVKHFEYIYKRFVMNASGFNNFTLNGGLYQWLIDLGSTIPEFRNIKDALEKLNRDFKQHELLEKNNLYKMNKFGSENPELKSFLDTYKKNVGEYIERMFRHKLPETMTPDFNKCIDKYDKPDIYNDSKNDIHIEEYKVKSPDGDELVFAMAYDNKGRVYIDNIYNPNTKMNSYGTIESITQMGYLVYKPEDYNKQAVIGIPEKYLKIKDTGLDSYVDINNLWTTIPVIKQYKQELIKRGVLK